MQRFASLAAVAALVSIADAQAPTAARGADSAFARGDWNTALSGYRELLKRDSTTPAVWFRVGVANHSLGRFRDGVDALMRARRLGANALAIELQLARTNTRLGDHAQAFVHLDSVERVAPRGMNPSVVRDDTAFSAIRNQPRFTALVARLEAIRFPCRATPNAREFDFWIGAWDVAPWTASPGTPRAAAGVNDIQPILERCVLVENWKGTGGGEGKSFNYFDTNQRKWRQIWVADGGSSLDYAGEFRDGAMRFEGWSLSPQGSRVLQKLTFTPFGKDTVRQTFEASADSGKTWTVTFDARYVRR